jgi:GTPase SAR1 family protein
MTASEFSKVDDLIQQYNPFAGHTVVRSSQVWGKSLPDVPSINAHVSDTVFDVIHKINQNSMQTVGITVVGDRGLGKTQVISRIRHHYKQTDQVLFIYMGEYGEKLSKIKSKFLETLTSSLRAYGQYEGIMQWQEIAAHLINEAKGWNYTAEQYIQRFPDWLNKHSTKAVDHFTDLIFPKQNQIIENPYIIRAILWTLSRSHAIYATYWLSGMELAERQAQDMGLPNFKTGEKEVESFKTTCQILNLVSQYKIPVICFDELDAPYIDELTGFSLPQITASFAKDLFNNIKRGLLVLAMYEPTWLQNVKSLQQAEAVIHRIASYPQLGKPISLNYLKPNDVIALVSQWLKEFYTQHQVVPPHPLYPFTEAQLIELGKLRPKTRDVLGWCASHWKKDKIDPPANLDVVKPAFENELAEIEQKITDLLEDSDQLAETLAFSFERIIGKTIENVKIESIQRFKQNTCYLHFKINGEENGQPVKIGLAVIQSSGNAVQAILKQLVNYKKFDLTRGCLVRSKTISPNAKLAHKYLNELQNEKGGEWVRLPKEDIKPLLAIYAVYKNQESYGLKPEQIFDFIEKSELVLKNPIICEILSDPSGQAPDGLIDEDIPISIPQSTSSSDSDLII